MTSQALLFILSAIGIAETVYLIEQRKNQKAPVCPIGSEESCQIVLGSKYNKVLGIYNDVLGLIFYIVASLIFAFLAIGSQPLIWLVTAKIIILGGLIMSLILTYFQWRVIKAWCFWCLMSSATICLMAIIILASKLV